MRRFYDKMFGGIDQFLLFLREISPQNENYISDIQHVRRRETVAMTPDDCLTALNALVAESSIKISENNFEADKKAVLESIVKITESPTKPLVASSGLSIQYAIMMGLMHDAAEKVHATCIG